MPRPLRALFPNAFYHIFNRGVEKRPIVSNERDRRTFLHILATTVAEFHLRLFAYCLMENHFHLFLQTRFPNLNLAMQKFQSQFAQYTNSQYDRVGPLFQGRYQSRLVESERYGLILVRYIHRNPLEAGVASKLEDYPWSSYPCYVGQLPEWNWLETRWVLAQFHADLPISRTLFRNYHQVSSPDRELKILRRFNRALGKP